MKKHIKKTVFLLAVLINILLLQCAAGEEVAVEEQIHDVAIDAIRAPEIAYQNDIIPIYVSVINEGNVNEYGVQIVLKDLTDDVIIDMKTVNVYTSHYIPFLWNTKAASVGSHVLEAKAIPVEGEIDTIDNIKTTTITIEQAKIVNGNIPSLNTNKPIYIKGSTVKTIALVENLGNQVLHATIHFTYLRPDHSIANIEDTTVSVQVGSTTKAESDYQLPRKGNIRGTWTVKAELIYNGQVMDVKTTTFELVNKL